MDDVVADVEHPAGRRDDGDGAGIWHPHVRGRGRRGEVSERRDGQAGARGGAEAGGSGGMVVGSCWRG